MARFLCLQCHPMVHVEERETKEEDAPPAETCPPLVCVRLVATLALLAGLLILAHGCHGPDEDHELFAPRMVGPAALHRDAPRVVPFSARAALSDEGDATAGVERARNVNGSPPGFIHSTSDVHS